MEPIPETARAIADFGPFAIEHEDLLPELLDEAQRVVDVVPECVGISVSSNVDELTFTVVATAAEIAVLDAVQYVTGGPCVAAVAEDRVVAFERDDPLDERRWQLFARASAAASVASTLTLPILDEARRVAGSVNLYGSSPTSFDGHHEAVARIFSAWAPGAVTNADLSFQTRTAAARAPEILRTDIDLTIACSAIAAQTGSSLEDARQRLTEAAKRAGVAVAQLAQTIIELQRDQEPD
jgi:GAF domain-containing protein